MKDMKVPLDILWLNKGKQVVYIVKNAQPDMSTDVIMQPKQDARYVLELPQGSVDNSAIKVGQSADFTVQEAAS